MDTIKLRLPANREHSVRIVEFWGERRLQGFANTGVFSISSGVRTTTADESDSDRYADDGIGDTTIDFNGALVVRGYCRGEDPYNRYGDSVRTSSL